MGLAQLLGMLRIALFLISSLLLVACEGVIMPFGGDTPIVDADPNLRDRLDPDSPNYCPPKVERQPLRRLSSEQYTNTIRDLFGGDLGIAMSQMATFPETRITHGFANDASANTVDDLRSSLIEDNAATLAESFLSGGAANVEAVLPCAMGASVDETVDGCIDQFISEFGLKAFRRPVSDPEAAAVRAVYDRVRREQGAAEALSSVIQFFLQSPALLYRAEPGEGSVSGAELISLSDYARATRLSYLFLNSAPDQELLRAAQAGQVSSHDEVAAQAERLANDPRVNESLTVFFRDWFSLYRAADMSKDRGVFPNFNAVTQEALTGEIGAFVNHVMNDGGGTLGELFSSDMMPVSQPLESIYGVSSGSSGPDEYRPTRVEGRRGLLTLASFLSVFATESQSNAITRGAFIRSEILCGEVPALPDEIDVTVLEEAAGNATARERLAPLTALADCSGCHTLFNPIGLSLENFDALGQYRETENGVTIDTSTTLVDLDDVDGTYQGAQDMIEALAESETLRNCAARQWFRFAMGRVATPEDQCSLDQLETSLAESNGDIRALLLATTQTEAFLYRRPEAP